MTAEYYKKRLVDLRASLLKAKEKKKKDNEYYAKLIKGTSITSTKASYRKSKIDRAASNDRQIESIKRQIDSAKVSLARVRKK